MSTTAALVFARCAGFVFRAPGFSHPSVPHAVRVGFALVLTLGLAPGVRAAHTGGGVVLVFALAGELALGAAIGFGASVLYDGAYAGGRALDDYAGIRGNAPNISVAPPSGFGRLWSLVCLAAFFLLDGYAVVIGVLADDFSRLPPGSLIAPAPLTAFALAVPALILKAAILLAGPAVASIFVVQFGLGALSRAVPRFQSFMLSFPLVFAIALIVTIALLPVAFAAGGRPWMAAP